MELINTRFPEVKILVPSRYADERGFFSEIYNHRTFAQAEIRLDFVQDNHSYSAKSGTVRGLHFQTPPYAQDKLVRVARGAIFDVIVDLRHGSPTFGEHMSLSLAAKEWEQVLIPAGFAHGLCTLEQGTEVVYKATNYYSPVHDKGIRWCDPALGIEWPVSPEKAIVSPRDRALPFLRSLPQYFTYAGETERREEAFPA